MRRAATLFVRGLRSFGVPALNLTLDAGWVALGFYLAYRVRFHADWWTRHFPYHGGLPSFDVYGSILYAVVPLWIMIFWYSSRLYAPGWVSTTDRFLRIAKGCFLGVLAAMAASFFTHKLEHSRMMILLTFPLSLCLIHVSHMLVFTLDRFLADLDAGYTALVLGDGKASLVVAERLTRIAGSSRVHRLEKLPAPEELDRWIRERGITRVLLTQFPARHASVIGLAEVCDDQGVEFTVVPDLLELRMGELQFDESLGLPAFRIQHTSLSGGNFLAKRIFDLAFSALVLAAAAGPFALASLLIRLDSAGPVFFRQKRFGYKGRVFEAVKFRTMNQGAEAALDRFRRAVTEGQGAFFKMKTDPRITRVGRFLRRLSLDEFPQFINVLRGEMSVVGPRPLAVVTGELEALTKRYGETAAKRHNIFPGITGLWQVSGRSDMTDDQRFALDLYYIEHWSLGLDLKIILRTIPVVLFGKGAY